MGSEITCTAAETAEQTKVKWDDLLFEIKRSVRYHSKRADFLGFCMKATMGLSIFVGMSVFALLINKYETLSRVMGATMSLFTILCLVFKVSDREQQHMNLKKQFIMLQKNMMMTKSITQEILAEKLGEYYTIEADEPDIVEDLNTVCYNEQSFAQGSEEQLEIGRFRKIFCQFNLPGKKENKFVAKKKIKQEV
jgi:hypothetical protein